MSVIALNSAMPHNRENTSVWNSPQAGKLMSAYGAVKILTETSKSQKRDTLTISMEARQYTKESLVALVDSCFLRPDTDFSFYFSNYNNPKAILDAINFDPNGDMDMDPGHMSENGVSYRDFSIIRFTVNGKKQSIPRYAIPKMNAKVYPQICAKDNEIILSKESYYSYVTKSGKRGVFTVHNGRVGQAYSEKIRQSEDEMWTKENREMNDVGIVLTDLVQGYVYGISHESANLVLPQIGIEKGHFTINAGMGEHHYIFRENGDISDVDEKIKQLNTMNWIEVGYQPGDVFKVYGNEYVIEDDGHIHVSVDDGFKDTKVIYPPKKF